MSGVERSYQSGPRTLHVLRGVDLQLNAGEITGLVGPSGSGKSTLLHIAGLLELPDAGSVWFDGVDALKMGDRERTLTRRLKLGFVYQFHHLLAELNARDNVAAPLLLNGVSGKEARRRADELLALLGLAERSVHQPGRMSGGEQQRVAIARAMVNQPRVLIADEPTGNLDPETSLSVFRNLFDLARSQGAAVLVATHNLELATMMDRVVTLDHGRLEAFHRDLKAAESV